MKVYFVVLFILFTHTKLWAFAPLGFFSKNSSLEVVSPGLSTKVKIDGNYVKLNYNGLSKGFYLDKCSQIIIHSLDKKVGTLVKEFKRGRKVAQNTDQVFGRLSVGDKSYSIEKSPYSANFLNSLDQSIKLHRNLLEVNCKK